MAKTALTKTGKSKEKKTKVLKQVKPAMPLTPEENLKRLVHSPILMNFVKKQNGAWNHQDWLNLLAEIKKKGFDPIDTDQVGLRLEEKKAQFLAK